jgi:hypothetical protein
VISGYIVLYTNSYTPFVAVISLLSIFSSSIAVQLILMKSFSSFLGLVSCSLLAMVVRGFEPPIPGLIKDFHLECDLNPRLSVGFGPGGVQNNWISFTGGTWEATWGAGTIEVRVSVAP